jgi:GTP-binding protein Era
MTTNNGLNHRSGFVAVSGRPNVGKSTLVNRMVGMDLCIASRKAQTTRNRIAAIHNTPDAQIVILDAPGIHEAATPLNKALAAAAMKTLEDADAALLLTTPSEKVHADDLRIIDLIRQAGRKSVLAINKIDLVPPEALLPLMEAFSGLFDFEAIIPVSALRGEGIDELTAALVALLPPGPALYPEDEVTDLPTRFFVAELIREQVINLTSQEVPYKTAVVVETFKERDNGILIQADIHTERQSQKKIVVGKNGEMIKRIGIAARQKIEAFLNARVHLELFVKTTPKWTRDPKMLKEFGYLHE